MPKLPSLPRDAKYLAAALLLVKGYKQNEIARTLGVSESTVTHWVKGGQDRYWRVGAVRGGPELASVPHELKRQAQSLIQRPAVSTHELARLSGAQHQHMLSVHVVSTSWDDWRDRSPHKRSAAPVSESVWQAWLAEFARLAAPRARHLLAGGKFWGVTWGSHVAALIDAINAMPRSAQPRRRGVLAMPLCGDRCGAPLASESSSSLAEALQRVLTGNIDRPLSLSMVPAFILGDLNETEVVTMWKHIARSEAYCDIFGAERVPVAARASTSRSHKLVKAVDGVLTSVSRDGHPFGYGVKRMYENAGYDRREVEKRYMGDIGGIGLVRPGETGDPKLEQRWTGITREDMLACAARAGAKKANAVGVVLIVSGADRADSVLESLRLGFVSHLIADDSLNVELMRRVQASPWSRPKAPTRAVKA